MLSVSFLTKSISKKFTLSVDFSSNLWPSAVGYAPKATDSIASSAARSAASALRPPWLLCAAHWAVQNGGQPGPGLLSSWNTWFSYWKTFSMIGTTWVCESSFSTVNVMKSNHRSISFITVLSNSFWLKNRQLGIFLTSTLFSFPLFLPSKNQNKMAW